MAPGLIGGAQRLSQQFRSRRGVEGETPCRTGSVNGLRNAAVGLRLHWLGSRVGRRLRHRAAEAFKPAAVAAAFKRLRQGEDTVSDLLSGTSKPDVGLEVT